MVNFFKKFPIALGVVALLMNGCGKLVVLETQKPKRDRSAYSLSTVILPDELIETSALERWDNLYWTINDSGGKATLYGFNGSTGEIEKSIKIKNVKNNDWEEIAQDEKYIYIGDFGNNLGNRKDLTILRIKKSDLARNADEVAAEKINFHYPEQKDFSKKNRQHDFDTEAMVIWQGKIHLFTKEWKSLGTAHYLIDANPGEHSAEFIERFQTNFLVTAADIGMDKNKQNVLYLLGYTSLQEVFILKQLDLDSHHFFNSKAGKPVIVPLGYAAEIGQTEGLDFTDGKLCITAEAFTFGGANAKQSLHCLSSN